MIPGLPTILVSGFCKELKYKKLWQDRQVHLELAGSVARLPGARRAAALFRVLVNLKEQLETCVWRSVFRVATANANVDWRAG